MLTYLDAEDKDETKHLWHMCFPEDSESFIEYYYKEKTKDNEILVKKDNGLLISMVQYNPYAVKLRGRLWKLDYLVGVATEESRRREGHFRDVFVKMLHDGGGSRKADHVSGSSQPGCVCADGIYLHRKCGIL